jgi:GDPmannose 4,6-dehydratase
MWLILQHDKPEDWVIATGQTTTVRDFVKMAFEYVGIKLRFEGKGVDEVGIIDSINETRIQELELSTSHLKLNTIVVAVDLRYFRPTEVDLLLGDPSKAERELGWEREYKLEELVNDMMKLDLKLMQKDEYLKEGGYKIMSHFE